MTYHIAWWNLENLFDVYNSPNRSEKLQKQLKKELEGWGQDILDKKISQLSKIIMRMNHQKGPDILGICEVENKSVLKQLVNSLAPLGRNYGIVHHDMSDKRGIDVAFIYDADRFSAHEQFNHTVVKRSATRDIFQVNFKSKSSGNLLILIGNHWPSRRGGQYGSEPYRIVAAETLSYWNERIMEIYGDNTAIIAMGDFNDEPFDRSVTQYALATNCEAKVLNSNTPRLYNLMHKFLGEGIGSHYYSNFPNLLDQLMISKGILNGNSGYSIDQDSAKIEMYDEMTNDGDYPYPIRFGRPSSGLNECGFSDHFPISVVLEDV